MRRRTNFLNYADDDGETRHNSGRNFNEMIIAQTTGEYNGDEDSLGYPDPHGGGGGHTSHGGATKRHMLYWDPEATRCLIQLRHERDVEFVDGNCSGRKGQIWIDISERMAKMGYDFGVDKISKKWHNILMTYKKNVEKKKRTGRVNWEYFSVMDEFLGNRDSPAVGDGLDDTSGDNDWDDSFDASDVAAVQMAPAGQSGPPLVENGARYERFGHLAAVRRVSPLLVPLVSNGGSGGGGAVKAMKRPRTHSEYDEELGTSLPEKKRDRPMRMSAVLATERIALKKEMDDADSNSLPPLMSVPVPNSNGGGRSGGGGAAGAGAAERGASSGSGGGGGDDCKWMQEYFQKKLEVEREKIKHEQERHRDYMNFQKMTLMLQEKIEKTKVEALRNLTEAINRLI